MHKSLTRTSLLFCLLAFITAGNAASTSLGKNDAMKCYEASIFPLSLNGTDYCTNAIRKGGLSKRDLAATYSNRGIIYSKNGEFEKAMDDHNRAINISPKIARAYINRGNVYFHIHEYEAALAEFDKAIVAGGGPALTLLSNKALTLIKLHRLPEARSTLEFALLEAPDSLRVKGWLEELNSAIEQH